MGAATAERYQRDRKWWKERWVAGTYAKLKSPTLLDEFMKQKAFSKAELARRASRERLAETGKRVSRQMISQLVNGGLTSCETDLAACIERVLDLPPHVLFDVLEKSSGERHNGNRAVTAA